MRSVVKLLSVRAVSKGLMLSYEVDPALPSFM